MSSSPLPASSSGVEVTDLLRERGLDSEQTTQHFDARGQLLGILAEALGAHRSTSFFGAVGQRQAQLGAVLHGPERRPQSVFYHRPLFVEQIFAAPSVADAATKTQHVGIIELPQHAVAVGTRPPRRRSGVGVTDARRTVLDDRYL